MRTKQVIVMRTDLNMRKGKMIAQGAHASMKVLLDKIEAEDWVLGYHEDEPWGDWLGGKFTKICCQVSSEEELLTLYKSAKDKGLPVALITDAGLTEFGGVATNTCIAIGPHWEDEINSVTGHLKLL